MTQPHAPCAHPTVRAIAEAAEGVRDRLSLHELGRRIGHAHSTVLRRDHLPVIDWPARDLVKLAVTEPELRDAITAALMGMPQPSGEGRHLPSALVVDANATEKLNVAIREAYADNRLTVAEIDHIMTLVAQRQASDRALVADLRAKRGGR